MNSIINSNLVIQLVKRDFTRGVSGSMLGIFWLILEPIATTTILAIVFSFGFKGGGTASIPFFIYMFTGMIVFNFFSIMISDGAKIIQNNSYLLKKVNISVGILPIVKYISAAAIHLLMFLLLIIACFFHSLSVHIIWSNIFYYFLCLSAFSIGLTYLLSSVSVFIPDIQKILAIGLRFLFYGTPIFWEISRLPEKYHYLVKLNPIFYIVEGYRASLLQYQSAYSSEAKSLLFFWTLTIAVIVIGIFSFNYLKNFFGDEL